MSSQASFYITGGTIPPDAPSYIPRSADNELLNALLAGELCYVLNARQMGKSSLCVRTRAILETKGVRTSFLDLQKFGSSATAEQWYRSLIERLGNDLKLRAEVLGYWRENQERTPIDRFFGAIREVALEKISEPIVVFIDEIDVVRDFGFKTDEFFAGIRQALNERANDAVLKRLTFCILGTVAPTDLIRDVRLSPFNVGTRVQLSDFTAKEAQPFGGPLPGGAKTLERVMWWTNGHPYLTQRLCSELTTSDDVDGAVARLFFSKSDAEVDENIKNVRNGLLRMGGVEFDRTDLLMRYGLIASGKRVPDDDTDPICTALRLSGVVTSRDGLLASRNRVYGRIFDCKWVEESLPDAEVMRQKAAYRRGVVRTGLVSGAVILLVATLGVMTWMQNGTLTRTAKELRVAEGNAQEQAKMAREQSRIAIQRAAERDAESKRANARAREALANLVLANKRLVEANLARNAESSAKRDALAKAVEARRLADIAERESYVATMNLIPVSYEINDFGRIEELLRSTKLNAYRGFEWGYWNRLCHLELLEIRHTAVVNCASFSPDGTRIVMGDWDGVVRVVDATDGRNLFERKAHKGRIAGARFTPDGQKIVTASYDGRAKIWDATLATLLHEFKGNSKELLCVDVSPDGKRFVAGGTNAFCTVWDVNSGAQIAVLKGYEGLVDSIAFSPNGRWITTLSSDGTVRVWDAATGIEAKKFVDKSRNRANSVRYSPDGQLLLLAGRDGVRLLDADLGKATLVGSGLLRISDSAAFSPDGKFIIGAGADGAAKVLDAKTGEEVFSLRGHHGFITSASYSPDGKKAVTASRDNTVRVWDAGMSREALDLVGHSGILLAVGCSGDGRLVVTGSSDGTARLWDSQTGVSRLSFKDGDEFVTSVALSRDGKRAVTGCSKSVARIWDMTTGAELQQLKAPNILIFSVCFSPDDKRVATAGADKVARVWDVTTGRVLLKLEGHTDSISSVRFSPDGNRIVTGSSDGTARIWDAKTGRQLRVVESKLGTVSCAEFSPDSKRIAYSSVNRIAKVIDATTGNVLFELKGHANTVTSISFSPNGKRIATSGGDKTVRVWDADTGRETLVLKGNSRVVFAARFLAGNDRIISVGADKTARIWLSEAERKEK